MNFGEYKDIIKTLAFIVLLTAINYFIPFLSMAVLLIWPVPIVYLSQKKESSTVLIVIIIAAVINGFLFGYLMGLMTIIGFGLVGFVIGNVIKERFSPLKTLIIAIITVLISQSLIIYVSSTIINLDYYNILQQAVERIGEDLDQQSVEQLVFSQMTIIRMISPSLIAISATLTGSLNYYISAWYLRRRGLNIDLYKPITNWYFPRWILSILIVITLLFNTNIIFLNINIYSFFLVFLQGFAVILNYLNRRGSSFLLKAAFVFLIFILPPVPIGLVLLGLLDLWFNFRKQSNQAG